jgi:glycosyltransferase involved in cell wall biosynthesis
VNILLLAPHPFYQARGTPIAVNLILKSFSERGENVDVLTFHEGQDVLYEHVHLKRTPGIFFINNLRPGFSFGKLICDFLMFFSAFLMVLRRRYDLIHAVEESVFMAILFKMFFRIPYVYDMDSSMAQQLIDKFSFLQRFHRVLFYFEGMAVRHSIAVIAVCDALADSVSKYNPQKAIVLRDISLLDEHNTNGSINLREELGIKNLILMYIGNLEKYQGIDLLLESFFEIAKNQDLADLIIIGGDETDILSYKEMIKHRNANFCQKIHFLGAKPIEHLAAYLSQADILVSPRIKGNNTPMKIYSYLHSGKAVLATALNTHTQILTPEVSVLAQPRVKNFAESMLLLIHDDKLRDQLGRAGKQLIEEKYSYKAFRDSFNHLYDWIADTLSESSNVKSENRNCLARS